MTTPRRCFAIASLSLSLAACSQPAAPQDSGRADSPAAQDAANAPADSANDGERPDAATPMDAQDVPAITDAAPSMDAPSPTPDSATDAPSPPRDAPALSCTLPLGGTCPAGSTCPAGDGCNRCTCPASGGTALCTRIACPPDSGVPADAAAGACRTAADCRLFESYCDSDPCRCVPLSSSEVDPRCDSRTVTCFVPPCRGQTVDCVGGRCVLAGSL